MYLEGYNGGRTSIGHHARAHGSIRAMHDKLVVVRKKCGVCGHHKAFQTQPMEVGCDWKMKCCKCGRRMEDV